MSLNAFISIALPDGSLKNIVLCSPISPLNLVVGLIIKSIFLSFICNKNSSNSFIDRTTPKCGTGTSSPSTRLIASSLILFETWQTS